ncbi:MAG: hypothetical protein A3I32_01485 [Candidatus Yanofskybacteria bacterium RIFCSPLOWO2_02_FULL_45_10]|uniref:HicB-like antitoxin of toxin-antitoxin system domain-containing protein n=2 Tax=Candidatus Yanofskyibacteriota TaxID=1752733 RepID=A0A1F8G067_9BACT|nr:MAG: hypothetical protein A3F25_03080 [Candidatus Yanofskybacteria bacterium RIFCSPHIGHO2_12_FULL_45_19b]OGN32970.1 MAG: hypothetical protein A3I32_01485 [Candidatus Yanofskybacteria bacterium RIFCSPLOWO2_02_FULL_45_10]
MKQFNLPIIIEQDKDGYFVSCPQLSGCYSQGESYEEAVENIKDAITLHLQDKIANKEELTDYKPVSISTVNIVLGK